MGLIISFEADEPDAVRRLLDESLQRCGDAGLGDDVQECKTGDSLDFWDALNFLGENKEAISGLFGVIAPLVIPFLRARKNRMTLETEQVRVSVQLKRLDDKDALRTFNDIIGALIGRQ